MKSFSLISAAGYVAPRHMAAIKDTGNNLIAAYDPNDSVGVIDNYFPSASFFTEFERFDRHLDKLNRSGNPVDYLTVCSPNYLHDSHIRFGLRNDIHVICEKPVVLNPWNLEALEAIEKESKGVVNTILQLRLHPAISSLKQTIEGAKKQAKKMDVDLTYITPRGNWYYSSWKGDISKSGGIATNIGVHFFDVLSWLFGALQQNVVHVHTHDRAAGYLEFENARVRWFLSINAQTLPKELNDVRTYRSMTVNGEEIKFSDGFTDLHTESYRQILEGKGYSLADAKPSIEIIHDIRHQEPQGLKGDYHPLAKLPLLPHPFTNR